MMDNINLKVLFVQRKFLFIKNTNDFVPERLAGWVQTFAIGSGAKVRKYF